ncbi:MAG: hypothetical protein J6M93_00570 [Succinivibrio sp.]|nr:hypothetical protein [Succinivibrio sp.]
MNKLNLAVAIGSVLVMLSYSGCVYAAEEGTDDLAAVASDVGKNTRTRQLDEHRKQLRQELLNDQAEAVQRRAVMNSKAGETPEEKAQRQQAYAESVAERGEYVILSRATGNSSNARLSSSDLRALTDWANDEANLEASRQRARQQYSPKYQLEMQRQRELANQRRTSIKDWATGKTDIKEVRRRAREETIKQMRDEIRQELGSN